MHSFQVSLVILLTPQCTETAKSYYPWSFTSVLCILGHGRSLFKSFSQIMLVVLLCLISWADYVIYHYGLYPIFVVYIHSVHSYCFNNKVATGRLRSDILNGVHCLGSIFLGKMMLSFAFSAGLAYCWKFCWLPWLFPHLSHSGLGAFLSFLWFSIFATGILAWCEVWSWKQVLFWGVCGVPWIFLTSTCTSVLEAVSMLRALAWALTISAALHICRHFSSVRCGTRSNSL